MTIRQLLRVPVLLALIVGCQPAAARFTTQDEATLRGMFEATPGYVRTGAWETWAAQYTEDAVFQPPNAPLVMGRANLIAWGRGFPPVENAAFSKIAIAGEGNFAYGTSSYLLKLKGMPADSGKQLVVFRRPPGGSWAVVAVSFNSDVPAPAPIVGTARP